MDSERLYGSPRDSAIVRDFRRSMSEALPADAIPPESSKPTKFWWQEPGVDFAKVTYRMLNGHTTQAYIDLNTGRGENKHTDEPVHVVWSEEQEIWEEQS